MWKSTGELFGLFFFSEGEGGSLGLGANFAFTYSFVLITSNYFGQP